MLNANISLHAHFGVFYFQVLMQSVMKVVTNCMHKYQYAYLLQNY